jgi:hypothetical protein
MKLLLAVAIAVGLFIAAQVALTGFEGDGEATGIRSGTAARTISRGEAVDLGSYLNPDGYTVVEFTADW